MASSKKWAKLSLDYLKSRLHYNPETGLFTWLPVAGRNEWNTRWAGKIAGSWQEDSVNINLDKTLYKAHQLAWLYMTGEVVLGIHIDHEDKNQHNNKWHNLRLASHSQNLMNRPKTALNTTGYKGVTYDRERGKFVAQIDAYKKHKFIGRFNTAEEAAAAYAGAAQKLHGEFARTA